MLNLLCALKRCKVRQESAVRLIVFRGGYMLFKVCFLCFSFFEFVNTCLLGNEIENLSCTIVTALCFFWFLTIAQSFSAHVYKAAGLKYVCNGQWFPWKSYELTLNVFPESKLNCCTSQIVSGYLICYFFFAVLCRSRQYMLNKCVLSEKLNFCHH